MFYDKSLKNVFLRFLYKTSFFIICSIYVLTIFFFLYDSGKRIFVYPLKYKDEIFTAAEEYALDKAFVYAVIKTESGFNPDAKSAKTAKGLMQLTDSTAKYIATLKKIENYDIFDVETNLDFGCFYLKYLSEKFSDLFTVAAAYNAGEGNVTIWLTLSEYSDDGVTLNAIPYNETRVYVEKIKKSFDNYKKLYGNILDK